MSKYVWYEENSRERTKDKKIYEFYEFLVYMKMDKKLG